MSSCPRHRDPAFLADVYTSATLTPLRHRYEDSEVGSGEEDGEEDEDEEEEDEQGEGDDEPEEEEGSSQCSSILSIYSLTLGPQQLHPRSARLIRMRPSPLPKSPKQLMAKRMTRKRSRNSNKKSRTMPRRRLKRRKTSPLSRPRFSLAPKARQTPSRPRLKTSMARNRDKPDPHQLRPLDTILFEKVLLSHRSCPTWIKLIKVGRLYAYQIKETILRLHLPCHLQCDLEPILNVR